jgi:cyclomaltodextrinase / maltogenic alpha-amylase / neopullulanase
MRTIRTMLSDMYTPEWAKHAVFYQIFPDRFALSERVAKPQGLEPWYSPPTVHGYKGGDLLGVVEKLDYLQDLGITALYFNPVFQSASNHRYHTHDYFQVDPMLGGNAALRELLDEAHERNIKVVLDGVFNHASRGFFQFHDILENGEKSPYLDWFHVRKYPLNAYGGGDIGYDAWWGLPALPKFNTNTPAVREFLFSVATFWLHFGIDGWRLDVPNEIADDKFWQEFRRRCRAVNPECYIVGEIWDDATRWLQGDQFDAVMNYPIARAIYGFVAKGLNDAEIMRSGFQKIYKLDAVEFVEELGVLFSKHRPEVVDAQLNLLCSHDTPRALTILKQNETALRLAILLQFFLPGVPCLYYGDELGLSGNHDPDNRAAMPWQAEQHWNQSLRDYVKGLLGLYHQHPALRRGVFKVLYAKGKMVVLERKLENSHAVVVVNADDSSLPFNVPVAANDGSYQDVLSQGTFQVKNQQLTGEVQARSGYLLML